MLMDLINLSKCIMLNQKSNVNQSTWSNERKCIDERSPDVKDAGGGVGDGGVDGAAVGAVAGSVVEHVEVGGGGEELPLRLGRRRPHILPLRLVDDEPLGVAGERVEAELEGAGWRGRGGHAAAAAEQEVKRGGRRGQAGEAARHERGAPPAAPRVLRAGASSAAVGRDWEWRFRGMVPGNTLVSALRACLE